MLYTIDSFRMALIELAWNLANPADYHRGWGKASGEPTDILILRRDPRQPINCGNDYARLCHDRHVLTVALQTEGLVSVDGQTYRLCESGASLVKPYQLHHYMVNQSRFFWLVITFNVRDRQFVRRIPPGNIQMTENQFARLYQMLLLYKDFLAGDQRKELLFQRTLGNFLLDLGADEAGGDGLPAMNPSSAIGAFAEANEYIFSRLDDPQLAVADVAAHLKVSLAKLYVIFDRMCSCPPGDYIRTQRIRRASLMMERTENGVAEIARLNGFSSPAIFSRCFRRVVGISPHVYMKTCR